MFIKEKKASEVVWLREAVMEQYRPLLVRFAGCPWGEVTDAISSCFSCSIRRSGEARWPVLPEGSFDSEVVFIGRNPGEQEQENRRPFWPLAPAGKTLEKVLHAVGLSREKVYLTNACFCFTWKNRPPESDELATCAAWKLLEMPRLERARVIFILGNDALRQTFGMDTASIMRTFGNAYWIDFGGFPRLVVPLYHPSYLARNPDTLAVTVERIQEALEIVSRGPGSRTVDDGGEENEKVEKTS